MEEKMKMKLKCCCLLMVLLSLIVVPFAAAEDEPAVEKAMLTQLMQALSQNNYEDFISNGTEQFKNGITRSAFDSVVKQLEGLIQGGYTTEYLNQMTQQGYKSYVWKISYETSKENTLAKLVVDDKKVAGFWLQ
jgi:negative regulator of sigma E activity